MLKRFIDIFFSFVGLILAIPVFVLIGVAITIESRGGVFYKQARVGKDNHDFFLYKFRSMKTGAHRQGLLTVGANDRRITKTGLFLRKYKLDELPQLINIIFGDMSIVGPRPEVRRFVELYNEQQMRVLTVRPGLTDYASIEYFDENKILGASDDPEAVYINKIMPAKLSLNIKYISEMSFKTDLKIIVRTILKIIR